MKSDTLIGYLDNSLRQEILIGGKEPDIVKRYCSVVDSQIAPIFNNRTINGKIVSFRSGFIHRKPFVKFVKPSNLYGKGSTELGDILFVKKTITNGVLIDIDITFSQVKKYSSGWQFEPHQFEYTINHPTIEVIFGKVYQTNQYVSKQFFIPQPRRNLFNYLLISNPMNLSCDLSFLGKYYSKGLKFATDCCLLGGTKNLICFCPNHDYRVFLKKFLFSKKGYGEPVIGNAVLSYVLDIVYKAHEWTLDPPEEFEDSYDGEKGGFGIIEFTLRNEANLPSRST